jgi:adenylate kinase
MIILFVGVQASGKGTQAKIIAEKKGFAHISTGDLLRDAKGELKKLADSAILQGALVPSKIIISLLKERLKQPDCKKGVILDGFPRNLEQAEDLEKIGKVDKIFEIYISDETAKKRLMGRWNCSKCKTSYNIITAPKPKKDKICDKCQILLFQRDDDKDEKAIEKRIAIYHEETEPILKKYQDRVIKINGEQSIEKITEDILKKL